MEGEGKRKKWRNREKRGIGKDRGGGNRVGERREGERWEGGDGRGKIVSEVKT